jgi:YidC/Oxa1 family membrane protein insertase
MLVTANIFQPLIDVFESVLKFFHNSIGVPWGWSIVVLTVVIRALLVPLALKQFHSMQRMQQHMPELKALQAKYKDDKQRQQQEMMKFYKENQINPFGSCLPLAAQVPVFISLFYMLRTSLRIDICPQLQPGARLVNGHWLGISHAHTKPCGPHGGASFLFVNDLTNKATGITLVVLILLYVGTQLASTLLMSTPNMDKMQRQLMLVLPLFFVVFVINFPAGVIVYWVTTNLWTMGQQYLIKRRIGPMGPTVEPPRDGGGGGPGGGGGGPGGLDGNGAGAGGGIGGMLRGRLRPSAEPAAVGAGSRPRRDAPPPPPPRKKKKRSGRRR